jgi:hypothetical protein
MDGGNIRFPHREFMYEENIKYCCICTVAEQRPRNKQVHNCRYYVRVMALQISAVALKWLSSDNVGNPTRTQQLNSNRATMFSVRSVPRCSKQDNVVERE